MRDLLGLSKAAASLIERRLDDVWLHALWRDVLLNQFLLWYHDNLLYHWLGNVVMDLKLQI